ncbi:hypothetical protein EON63_04010 [archaeon]|nr:MAG: hypothetical protein EON63_04010 [archaeon]
MHTQVDPRTRLTASQALAHSWFEDLRRARGEERRVTGIAVVEEEAVGVEEGTGESSPYSDMPPPSTTKGKRGQKRGRA